MQGDKLAPMTGQTPADRIEALEAALAMAHEALKASETFIDYVDQMIPLGTERSEECVNVSVQIENAVAATAPAVAAFIKRVEARGAAKALKCALPALETLMSKLDGEWYAQANPSGETCDALGSLLEAARAAELEGK